MTDLPLELYLDFHVANNKRGTMCTNRNRHGLLPEIDFNNNNDDAFWVLKTSNNAHFDFLSTFRLNLERYRVEIFSLPVGGVSQLCMLRFTNIDICIS